MEPLPTPSQGKDQDSGQEGRPNAREEGPGSSETSEGSGRPKSSGSSEISEQSDRGNRSIFIRKLGWMPLRSGSGELSSHTYFSFSNIFSEVDPRDAGIPSEPWDDQYEEVSHLGALTMYSSFDSVGGCRWMWPSLSGTATPEP